MTIDRLNIAEEDTRLVERMLQIKLRKSNIGNICLRLPTLRQRNYIITLANCEAFNITQTKNNQSLLACMEEIGALSKIKQSIDTFSMFEVGQELTHLNCDFERPDHKNMLVSVYYLDVACVLIEITPYDQP